MSVRDLLSLTEKGIWFVPFGLTAAVFAMLLLLTCDPVSQIRLVLIPAMAVYLIGAANVIFIKELMHIRLRAKNKLDAQGNLKPVWLSLFLTLHLALLCWFVYHLFQKGIL